MTDPIAGLNAALSDRYVIDRELGRGGMAMVYLARDLKHERFVALKTLRPEIAMALGRERFLREIKLAARLQHPNILAVYDSGDAGGVLYYVMPYVEGESLRDRLEHEPQLPLEDALQIAREVADALSYAHGHDVVHRDIKPENIMLSGGHAIVADFGIARAVSAAGGEKLTETGLAIGTPAYMSPEQAAGTGQVDRRSDIYSLACVLYETLAGQPPFTGPTAQAIMARHSLDSVPRLRVVREAVPDALEAVILRALAKVPADRFQTAHQFAEALVAASSGVATPLTVSHAVPGIRPRPWWRRPAVLVAGLVVVAGSAAAIVWGTLNSSRKAVPAGELDPQRIAVLYFEDLTRDTALAHLADGFTEGLIEQLGQVRALDVISRNGVAPFRGAEVAPDSVARVLSAGTLVRGSVEREGDRIRVTVRLVDGGSGADFSRESFALPAGDALAIRDSLVQQATELLRRRLGDEVRLRERQAGTRSVAAWSLVQRAERIRKEAEALLAHDDVGGAFAAFQRADTVLGRAEEADREWVVPIVLRGQIAYRWSRILQGEPREAGQWIASALGHAERALRIDPTHAEALELRGTVRYYRYLLGLPSSEAAAAAELRGAREDLETAVRERPNLASALSTLSHLYFRTEDVPSGLLAARRAYEADAYLVVANEVLHRLFLGSYDSELHGQASQWCDEGTRRFPRDYRFTECHLWMMTTPAVEPDLERAWRLLARLDSLVPTRRREFVHRHGLILVGAAVGRAGLKDSARRVLLRARADRDLDPGLDLAGLEAFARTLMGDYDEAIALIKQYLTGNPEHFFRPSGDVHWWWRVLQSDPRFRDLVATKP